MVALHDRFREWVEMSTAEKRMERRQEGLRERVEMSPIEWHQTGRSVKTHSNQGPGEETLRQLC